jgi:gluconate 5-dehydrogenase
VALVTGSSAGIGLALARALGQAGATVVLNGRDAGKLEAAAATLRGEGLTVHAQAFDVCDAAAVEAGVAAIEAEVGPIDILFNNAGTTQRAPFHEFPQEAWQRILRTNVDSMIIVGQAVARAWCARARAHRQHRVGAERTRPPRHCALCGQQGRGEDADQGHGHRPGAARHHRQRPGPGYFKTELTAALVADADLQPVAGQPHAQPPLGRRDADLGGAAVFLASDAARFVNGHILYVDGGVTATL